MAVSFSIGYSMSAPSRWLLLSSSFALDIINQSPTSSS